MLEHHKSAVQALVSKVESDQLFDAVILSGSLANGKAKASSDVDVYLVVSDSQYATRKAGSDLSYNLPCDYPGGYIDGKVITRRTLEAVAERGPEPMRASFLGSTVEYSAVGNLQLLVDRIPVYPEANRTRNIRDFYAQFIVHSGYFGPGALESGDAFMLTNSLASTVLFAGRLMLAQNRVLFPCPKQLTAALATCAELPGDFVQATQALLRSPDLDGLLGYLTLVSSFKDWGVADSELLSLFMSTDEWSWMEHEPALAQR